ncbi:MAG TPA: glycosyl hydrolase [Candidatus Acidoferrum sp.]|nr:glycosyl hydrolase [Candidatus Acidoferrum sp.]
MTHAHRSSMYSHALVSTVRRTFRLSTFLFCLFAALSLCLQPASISAVWTPPVPQSYFGLHIHHIGTTTPWPAAQFGQWRLWDAYVAWPNLEPHQGQWQFQTLDRYVTFAEEHGVNVLLPLGLSPTWASSRPTERSTYQLGNAAEPKNIEDWRDYVKTVATRYKGRIHDYEIWNEPNLKGFWSGNVAQMIDLTREAAQIIHEIDPHAVLVSPAATAASGTSWLSQFLVAGGGQYVDVIGYHFYVMPQPPEDILPLIQKVKQIMLENAVATKPLWDTETGWALPKPFPSPDLGAAYLARTYLLVCSSGVQRLYWYSWDNHNWVTIQTTEPDSKTLTPAGHAYETIYTWMVGARLLHCAESSDQTWTCELNRNGSAEWIVWNTTRSEYFVPPEEWHARFVVSLQGVSQLLTSSGFEAGPSPALVTSVAQ